MRKTTVLLLMMMSVGSAQDATAPLDGNKRIFHDALLDQMAGKWQLTGTIMGKSVHHTVEARWVLNHQFLQIHELDTADPATSANWYEALAMVGYDNTSERYVAHWNDVFGGRFSEPLGFGTRSGNEISFVFEYPDGPFRTVFRWLPDKKQWEWQMRQKTAKGEWQEFGRMTLAR